MCGFPHTVHGYSLSIRPQGTCRVRQVLLLICGGLHMCQYCLCTLQPALVLFKCTRWKAGLMSVDYPQIIFRSASTWPKGQRFNVSRWDEGRVAPLLSQWTQMKSKMFCDTDSAHASYTAQAKYKFIKTWSHNAFFSNTTIQGVKNVSQKKKTAY